MESQLSNLLDTATTVLKNNDQGSYTVPAPKLYPHQWLWDSCFISIGLRHLDTDRAKAEILSLFKGQWRNGMIPHNILSTTAHAYDRNIWRSWANPYSPDNIATSGITQPPVLAEAIVRIGEKLNKTERRSWYKQVLPNLIYHHEWLYNERDPHDEGLTLQIHPWESGLDNTPPWISELHEHQLALWIQVIKKLNLGWLINLFRRDTKYIPAMERLDVIEALALFSSQRRLRRKAYKIDKILSRSLFAIEDLTFNCILVRANQHIKDMASLLKYELPDELLISMERTEKELDELWDPYSGQYYSREFVTHKLLKEPSIATLMPLYAGTITKERADQLVRLLENQHVFGANYPVPSVPLNSSWFSERTYWQGPSWVNTNWLIIDGLRRMGYPDHADALVDTTLEMVRSAGCYEYFSPIDGSGSGAANFSWTAALAIDLIKTKK
ncbi:MAG: trehalase family glycosidase [Candidatus Saccharimonadales bacterium]